MSEYYGINHPNPDGRDGGRWRDVDRLRGAVIHVSVNAPSTESAEAVARYQSTQRTTYSGYNSLFDSDGHLPYWPDDRAPNGAKGGDAFGKFNDTLIHLSAACMTDTWARYRNWARLTLGFMAVEVRRIHDTYDVPYQVLTKSELGRGLRGFTTHHRLDPTRRSDPGAKVDGKGEFSFDDLFELASGSTPIQPHHEEDFMQPIKHGDSGVEVRQLQHLLNALIVHTGGGWHNGPDLAPITGQYDNATAERVQHCIWRAEGWVLGYPLYAEEEGGSRVTMGTLAALYDVMNGLRNGVYDLNPSSALSASGVDLKDPRAAAEWVRSNA